MISWQKFLTETVNHYRKEFWKLDFKSQEKIVKKGIDDSLLEPCQIEVFDYGEGKPAVWLVVHDNDLPDMMFKTHKDVKNLDDSEFFGKFEFFFSKEYIEESIVSNLPAYHNIFMANIGAMHGMPRDVTAEEIASSLLSYSVKPLWEEQVDVIEQSTDGLKKSIEKVSEKDIRNELLATTKRIDTSLQEIRRLDEEIGKVRRLVGVTKEIQDWRLLVTDVDRLKGEHIPKQVFDAKIERLDEKIEKGLENLNKRVDEGIKALNTRIEDLKAIKFWSKRTLLEIALAILAIIATLFASGILKF